MSSSTPIDRGRNKELEGQYNYDDEEDDGDNDDFGARSMYDDEADALDWLGPFVVEN